MQQTENATPEPPNGKKPRFGIQWGDGKDNVEFRVNGHVGKLITRLLKWLAIVAGLTGLLVAAIKEIF